MLKWPRFVTLSNRWRLQEPGFYWCVPLKECLSTLSELWLTRWHLIVFVFLYGHPLSDAECHRRLFPSLNFARLFFCSQRVSVWNIVIGCICHRWSKHGPSGPVKPVKQADGHMVCGLDRVTLTCTFELYFRQAFVHTTPHLSKKRNKTCLCAYMLHEHAQYFTFTPCGITRKRGWWLEIKHFLNASNPSVSLETLTADSVFLSIELQPGIQQAN